MSLIPDKGWLCPKCGRVNAPFLPHCDCHNRKELGEEAQG